MDTATGDILGPNQSGEILVKNPCTSTVRYFNNPEANKEAFDEDGFYRTGTVRSHSARKVRFSAVPSAFARFITLLFFAGDVGYYDEKEYIYIVDRIKDVIKYKTMQVKKRQNLSKKIRET